MQKGRFAGWKAHLDFLLRYMQMVRARSPKFFVDQGRALEGSQIARITNVDHAAGSITHDALRRLTKDEIHDFALSHMRREIQNGAAWMADLHWQVRTALDPYNPVITSEQPLFVKGERTLLGDVMTLEVLTDSRTTIYFPLCWEACLIGRVEPFDADVEPFVQQDLLEFRHMVAEMAPETVISPQRIEGLVLDGRPAPDVLERR